MTFEINPDLDVTALAKEYAANSRVRITQLLGRSGLAELYHFLEGHDGWWQLINTPDGVLEFDRKTRSRMTKRRIAELDAQVHAGVRTGFQYRYEGLRVPDDPDQVCSDEDPLAAFARLMCSDPMLELLRAITGHSEIAFTDGHATAYGPGDFLTGHDDNVAGKGRIAAYVFGMTPQWRLEWGGILLFHGPGGETVTGHVPRFNTLDLFSVPQQHSVSMVTAAAPKRRYAVTGWLRAES